LEQYLLAVGDNLQNFKRSGDKKKHKHPHTFFADDKVRHLLLVTIYWAVDNTGKGTEGEKMNLLRRVEGKEKNH
jgi:hypothetical protein